MKNIEKATNNMKMVYSILCNLKKCTAFVFITIEQPKLIRNIRV